MDNRASCSIYQWFVHCYYNRCITSCHCPYGSTLRPGILLKTSTLVMRFTNSTSSIVNKIHQCFRVRKGHIRHDLLLLLDDKRENLVERRKSLHNHDLRSHRAERLIQTFKKSNDAIGILLILEISKRTISIRMHTMANRRRTKNLKLVPKNFQLSEILSYQKDHLDKEKQFLLGDR